MLVYSILRFVLRISVCGGAMLVNLNGNNYYKNIAHTTSLIRFIS